MKKIILPLTLVLLSITIASCGPARLASALQEGSICNRYVTNPINEVPNECVPYWERINALHNEGDELDNVNTIEENQ